MLDIKFIRENGDLIKEAARKKKINVDVERLVAVDEKRRTLISEVDELRRLHKEFNGATDEAKTSKEKLSDKEFELRKIEEEFDDEVGPTGDIDIGEIAANYLSLEL